MSTNINLVVNLIGSGALVACADRVDLVKFVGNLFVVSFSDSERSTVVLSKLSRSESLAWKGAAAVKISESWAHWSGNCLILLTDDLGLCTSN